VIDIWLMGEMDKTHSLYWIDRQSNFKIVSQTEFEHDKPFYERDYKVTETTEFYSYSANAFTRYNSERQKIEKSDNAESEKEIKDLFVAVTKDIKIFDTHWISPGTLNKESVFNGHPISFYLEHKQIPQVCKDLYNGKRNPSDDAGILNLLDSIFTSNVDTKPFYFLTITRTMPKADGAYAEPLGMMGKQFVEKKTTDFADYFINNPVLTDKDFEEWAKTVAGEIEISAAEQEKEEWARLKSKMKSNCVNCGQRQVKIIDNFLTRVKKSLP